MKERLTITIDNELLGWLDLKVSEKNFANRSHAFEFLIMRKIKEEENEERDFRQ